jgi:DNA-binding transcriptional LysR family regulator
VQVVDHGGFSAAARELGLQKSKLSRLIGVLEERLGVRLIQRSTRRFSVTEIGREFYDRCVAMLVEAEAAEQVIAEMRSEPRGVLRMACPTALVSFQFGTLIARFLAANPLVEIHLESTNRRVDVIGEGFDIAIRVRFPPLEPTLLVMRKLDESRQCLVAAPALLGGRTALSGPADLPGLPSLDLGPARRDHVWRLERTTGENAEIAHNPRLVTDDMAALRAAATDGIGVVQLPTLLTFDDIQAGRLVNVLPDWAPPAGIVHAVFPSRRGLLPSVRALLDFLAEQCKAQRQAVGETPAA